MKADQVITAIATLTETLKTVGIYSTDGKMIIVKIQELVKKL